VNKIPMATLCGELGVEPGPNWETAAALVFGIRRNWPSPVDASRDAWEQWSTIVAGVIADLGDVPAESIRAAVLTYELESTLRHFGSSVAAANQERLTS